jgi:hypothetical protein
MAKTKENNGKALSLKKEIYNQLTGQLSATLPSIKELLGEKKFDSRVKKAAKLLSEGIKGKASKKTKEVKKKAAKKKVEAPQAVAEN